MMQNTVLARFTATYHRFGEGPGDEWLVERLEKASNIYDYKILACSPGVWGLEFLLFQVDFPVYFSDSTEEAIGTATERLNAILGDTDVDVLWVAPAVPNTI